MTSMEFGRPDLAHLGVRSARRTPRVSWMPSITESAPAESFCRGCSAWLSHRSRRTLYDGFAQLRISGCTFAESIFKDAR